MGDGGDLFLCSNYPERQIVRFDPGAPAGSRVKWKYSFGTDWELAFQGIAIGTEGGVYASLAGQKKLVALTPGGEFRWSYQMEKAAGAPMILNDGKIAVADTESIHAVSQVGGPAWNIKLNGSSDCAISGMALGRDGTMYAATYCGTYLKGFGMWTGDSGGFLHAIGEFPTPHIKWSTRVPAGFYYPPVIDGAGNIVAMTCAIDGDNGKIYVFNPDGGLEWEHPTRTCQFERPRINNRGDLLLSKVRSDDGTAFNFVIMGEPYDGGSDDGGLPDAGPLDAGGGDGSITDTGYPDAGVADSGGSDGGVIIIDSGSDAGVQDASEADSGWEDTGSADAQTEDAGGGEDAASDAAVITDAADVKDATVVDSGTVTDAETDGSADAQTSKDAGTDASAVTDASEEDTGTPDGGKPGGGGGCSCSLVGM
jgi:hypothetical protein